MTLHLKSRGYPFRPRFLFSSFIVVGFGFPTVYYFRRGQDSDEPDGDLSNSYGGKAEAFGLSKNCCTFVAVITKAMVRWPSG